MRGSTTFPHSSRAGRRQAFTTPSFGAVRHSTLIVANILARPLMELAPEMAHFVTPGGSIILSGILSRQRNAVLATYNGQKFSHVRTLWRDGWATLHLKRRNNTQKK